MSRFKTFSTVDHHTTPEISGIVSNNPTDVATSFNPCGFCGNPYLWWCKKKCSKCKVTSYCDKECQKLHWKLEHKGICVACPDSNTATSLMSVGTVDLVDTLSKVPDEIWIKIFNHLPISYVLTKISLVNKRFNALTKTSIIKGLKLSITRNSSLVHQVEKNGRPSHCIVKAISQASCLHFIMYAMID